MIYPSEGCGWAPDAAVRPGAAGSTQSPPSWAAPLDLATRSGSNSHSDDDGDGRPRPLLRPLVTSRQPTRRAVSTRLIS